MASKLKKSFRKTLLKILTAPLDEWGFETAAERDKWIRKQIKVVLDAQSKKTKDKPKEKKHKVKPSKVPTFPSSR